MEILKNGSERRIKRAERKAKRDEEKYKASEMAFFECKKCGCRFTANRNEYFITGARLQYGTEKVSVVALDCPYCGTIVRTALSVYLKGITRDELIRGSRYSNIVTRVNTDAENKNER